MAPLSYWIFPMQGLTMHMEHVILLPAFGGKGAKHKWSVCTQPWPCAVPCRQGYVSHCRGSCHISPETAGASSAPAKGRCCSCKVQCWKREEQLGKNVGLDLKKHTWVYCHPPWSTHCFFKVRDCAVVKHDVTRDVQGHQIDQTLDNGRQDFSGHFEFWGSPALSWNIEVSGKQWQFNQ